MKRSVDGAHPEPVGEIARRNLGNQVYHERRLDELDAT